MIYSAFEIWNGRRAQFDALKDLYTASALNAATMNRYTRIWRVTTTLTTDDAYVVATAPGINMYDAYAAKNGIIDASSVCVSIVPEQDVQDPMVWLVRFEYASDITINPLQKPTMIELDGQQFQRALYEDIFQVAILNSAGTPYDPPVEKDDSRPVVTFTRNEAPWSDASKAILYQDAVNATSWWGVDALQAKMMKITMAPKYDSLIPYAEVKYIIQFRKEGWDDLILDKGRHILDVNGKLVLARDPVDGVPFHDEVLLDGHGHQLTAGAAPIYNTVAKYQRQEFNDLSLP